MGPLVWQAKADEHKFFEYYYETQYFHGQN